jgi:spore maturation protein SpmA
LLNGVFVAAVLLAVVFAAWSPHGMEGVTRGALDGARYAAELALGLTGALALFLGLMRVASEAGLLARLARLLSPLLRRLFPGIPDGHPALSAVVLNLSATALGLGNAATPFGIQAMREMDRLNPRPGTATDAMVLFLALNTAGFGLIPTTLLSLRVSAGSTAAASILVPTWIAAGVGTLTAALAATLLARLPVFRFPPGQVNRAEALPEGEDTPTPPRFSRWATALGVIALLAVLGGLVAQAARHGIRDLLSHWPLPLLIGGLVAAGWAAGVRVYDTLVEGAKEGFQVALRILPYLVAILVMVGIVRGSGMLDLLVAALSPLTTRVGIPAELLPVILLRPLSGSGALGLTAEILKTHGPDSPLGLMASTIQGSTETTFYVLAVYCGAVGVQRTRHALLACLLADAVAMVVAIVAVRLMLLS